MSQIPDDLLYTTSDEWVRMEADGTVTVGITDYAQEQLGDLVYVEVPSAGRRVQAEEACGVVESVKAAHDVFAPLAGEVTAANDALQDQPEQVNQDPYGAGWLYRLKPDTTPMGLLDAAAYGARIAAQH
ncbi:MAG: glycine cleavage system protein GcvH [Candidatus Competibacterales bacterium]